MYQLELHQGGEPSREESPLYRPEFAWTVLVFTFYYAEQQLEDGNHPFVVGHQEGKTIKSL